jgi:hypothetical protein
MRSKGGKFIEAVQARAVRSAAGPSATRKQGKGVAAAAQGYLRKLRLECFGTSDKQLFEKRLDYATNELCGKLPRGARSWGIARKVLNIFLRDALYTRYLSDRFHIDKAEHFLEIPLDRITSSTLRKCAGRGKLPSWHGIRKLKPEESAEYQRFAAEYASMNYGAMARVHLDAFFWGLRDDKPCDQ